MYAMGLDLDNCIRCMTCAVACKMGADSSDGFDLTRVQVVDWGEFPNAEQGFIPLMCNHCEAPLCVLACSTGATFKMEDGAVLVDRSSCISCGACVTACPYGNRFLPGESDLTTVEKCDLCYSRLKKNRAPLCVEHCPGQCRIFGDLEDTQSSISKFIEQEDVRRFGETQVYYRYPKKMPPHYMPQAVDTSGVKPVFHWSAYECEEPAGSVSIFYSMCAECNHIPYCGSEVVVRDGEVVGLEKRAGFPNDTLCSKGIAQVQAVSDPERLLHPVKRTNPKGESGQWEQITWDEAIQTIG